MSRCIFLFLLCFVCSLNSIAALVQEMAGDVFFLPAQGQQVRLSRNFEIKTTGTIKVLKNSNIRLLLNKNLQIRLNEHTEIVLLDLHEESGFYQRLRLEKGLVQFRAEEDPKIRFESPLFSENLSLGEFFFIFDPKVPLMRLSVLEGRQFFRGLEGEQSHLVQAGQRADFVGLLDGDQVAYDVLLRGRRLAKGELKPLQQLSPKELQDLKKGTLFVKPKPAPIPKELIRQPGQICERPFAKFNECVWQFTAREQAQSDSCVRSRCNANGKWSDPQPVAKEKCQAKPRVAACDY
jgi:hypothetical protein